MDMTVLILYMDLNVFVCLDLFKIAFLWQECYVYALFCMKCHVYY